MLKIEIVPNVTDLGQDYIINLIDSEKGVVLTKTCEWWGYETVLKDILKHTRDLRVEYSDENSYYMD